MTVTNTEQTATSSAEPLTSNNPKMAATPTGGGGSLAPNGDDNRLHITFQAGAGQVYDAKSQPLNDTTTFDMPFTVAVDGVQVTSLSWVLESDGSADPTDVDWANLTAREGKIFQGKFYPQTGRDRTARLNIRDVLAYKYLKTPLAFAVGWNIPGGLSGRTYSPAFAVVDGSHGSADDALDRLLASKHADGVEKRADGSSVTGTGQSALLTTAGSSTATAAPTLTSTSGGALTAPTTTTTTTISSSSNGGGLSTGAIAGIAVGVGLAALLAAVLAVFFCMRRRRRRDQAAAASSAATADNAAVLEQKRAEMENLRAYSQSAGAAPYRDDNSSSRRGSSAAAEVAQRDTPRSERSVQGVSRHLVEDGMTDAEIRRLEAEEAHLDDEIQRANARR